MGGGARGCTFSGGWLFCCPGAGTGRDGRPDRDWRCRASDCAARQAWGSRNRFPPARLPRSAGFSHSRAPVPWPRPPVKPSDCRMIFCSVPFWRIATCAASRLRRSLPPGSPGSAISRRRRPFVACWSAWLRARRQRHRHPIHRRRHAGWQDAPVPGLDRCSCRTVTPRRSPPPECGRPTARRSLSAASPHSGSARAMPPCRSKLPTARIDARTARGGSILGRPGRSARRRSREIRRLDAPRRVGERYVLWPDCPSCAWPRGRLRATRDARQCRPGSAAGDPAGPPRLRAPAGGREAPRRGGTARALGGYRTGWRVRSLDRPGRAGGGRLPSWPPRSSRTG